MGDSDSCLPLWPSLSFELAHYQIFHQLTLGESLGDASQLLGCLSGTSSTAATFSKQPHCSFSRVSFKNTLRNTPKRQISRCFFSLRKKQVLSWCCHELVVAAEFAGGWRAVTVTLCSLAKSWYWVPESHFPVFDKHWHGFIQRLCLPCTNRRFFDRVAGGPVRQFIRGKLRHGLT